MTGLYYEKSEDCPRCGEVTRWAYDMQACAACKYPDSPVSHSAAGGAPRPEGECGAVPRRAPTPTPWQAHGSHIYSPDPDRALLAQIHNPGAKASDYPLEANRNFIVTAVNNHERLVALLVRWRHFNRYTHSPKNIEAETDALLAELGR